MIKSLGQMLCCNLVSECTVLSTSVPDKILKKPKRESDGLAGFKGKTDVI